MVMEKVMESHGKCWWKKRGNPDFSRQHCVTNVAHKLRQLLCERQYLQKCHIKLKRIKQRRLRFKVADIISQLNALNVEKSKAVNNIHPQVLFELRNVLVLEFCRCCSNF